MRKGGNNLIWTAVGEGYPEEVTFELRSEEKSSPQVFGEVRTLLDPIK